METGMQFQIKVAGQYPPSFSINYIAINKNFENYHRSCIR